MSFRKIVFWTHLCLGAITSLVILMMSVTGVILTYEWQLNQWARRGYRADLSVGDETLPIPDLLTAFMQAEPGFKPTSITLPADPASPAIMSKGRGENLYVDRYSARVLGNGETGMSAFMGTVTQLHRWLALSGEHRSTGRAVSGACNLGFLVLVVSGFYLWFPLSWTRRSFRNITWFRIGLGAKARDFNWHNVIGFWTCIPLFIVVLTAVVISYSWASNLLFIVSGDAPPQRRGPRPPQQRPSAKVEAQNPAPASADLAVLEALTQRTAESTSDWTSLTVSIPKSAAEPVSITIDRGNGKQFQKRISVIYDQQTKKEIERKDYSDNGRAMRWRIWMRFAHTGEHYGFLGQTIAGIASLGACFLVWTGLALSWRRYISWLRRRSLSEPASPPDNPVLADENDLEREDVVGDWRRGRSSAGSTGKRT